MQNENKKKVLSLHGLHGLQSAVCSLHGLRFGVTDISVCNTNLPQGLSGKKIKENRYNKNLNKNT